MMEVGKDGGGTGQSTRAHQSSNYRSKLHTNTQNSPQLSTKATMTEEEKKTALDLDKHTCWSCRKSKQGKDIFGWSEIITGNGE